MYIHRKTLLECPYPGPLHQDALNPPPRQPLHLRAAYGSMCDRTPPQGYRERPAVALCLGASDRGFGRVFP